MVPNEEILARLQQLETTVEGLQVELSARREGQKLAADEGAHYEQQWEKHVGELKDVLCEARDFIKPLREDALHYVSPEDLRALLVKIERAIGSKVESVDPMEDFDASLTLDLLGLVCEEELDYTEIVKWSREQRQEAERWAAQQHAMASDNDIEDSEILPKPVHVRLLQEKSPKRDDLYDVQFTPGSRPHPAVVWAERMKDSPKEWERLHRIEMAARAARSDFRTPKRDHTMSALCRVIDAVELERIKEWEGRS